MADDWRTPPMIFNELHNEFGFDLDAAATQHNALLENFISPEKNALGQDPWPGSVVFVNPPYGNMLEKFVRRCAKEAEQGKTIVALIPVRTRAAWWHQCVIGKAVEVRSVRRRPKFLRPDGTEPNFTMSCDSCLVVWKGVNNSGVTLLKSWSWN
jgi:phage N-6-adenine-methyltransferase